MFYCCLINFIIHDLKNLLKFDKFCYLIKPSSRIVTVLNICFSHVVACLLQVSYPGNQHVKFTCRTLPEITLWITTTGKQEQQDQTQGAPCSCSWSLTDPAGTLELVSSTLEQGGWTFTVPHQRSLDVGCPWAGGVNLDKTVPFSGWQSSRGTQVRAASLQALPATERMSFSFQKGGVGRDGGVVIWVVYHSAPDSIQQIQDFIPVSSGAAFFNNFQSHLFITLHKPKVVNSQFLSPHLFALGKQAFMEDWPCHRAARLISLVINVPKSHQLEPWVESRGLNHLLLHMKAVIADVMCSAWIQDAGTIIWTQQFHSLPFCNSTDPWPIPSSGKFQLPSLPWSL